MTSEIITRHLEELQAKENFLNVALGTKWKDGKDTGIPAIVVYVSKKVPAVKMALEHLIPQELDGVQTDVVELSPTTWKAGKTSMSQLHPDEQRRRLGHRGKPVVDPRHPIKQANNPKFSQSSNLQQYGSPVRNQQSCGECVGEGGIATTEGTYRTQVNNPNDPISLSVDDAFFCAGGTCENGLDVPSLLNYLLNTGVCSEACQPTKNVDMTCGAGRCPDWQQEAKKLTAWYTITDIPTMKNLLDKQPLICVMAVHQSFFNYVSGVYKSLGASDPVVGYHCIACFGHDEPTLAWGPIENSWGTGWGMAGWFMIANGDSEIDQQMWQVEVDTTPFPNPNPPVTNLAIQTSSLPGAIVDQNYSVSLAGSGGSTPYVWSITSGSLPQGLSLTSSTQIISGMPLQAGTFPITIQLIDQSGQQATQPLVLVVAAAQPPNSGPASCCPVVALLNKQRQLIATGNWTKYKMRCPGCHRKWAFLIPGKPEYPPYPEQICPRCDYKGKFQSFCLEENGRAR